ncbi:MarR family winged helix-turn-helix transcriptional regulator [Ornithinibacillus bavariensis]|uniref:MarR family transcriptional regulator n=1 Tax=Ornithinibacillus bavariensis TaxID=545502 RepID=A0A919X7D0_9BACI|nr:MarR family transcriptional regulator [Ornithinibacillus bavariensis]GIO27317.1 MarR family transcriptional regulator [Ornithinibacillus bavariensis]HAM81924.1 MarR family transcriptional regulator [Ornithinibacillus sp.]
MVASDHFNEDQELSLKLFVVLTRAIQAIEKQVVLNIKSYGLNLTEFGVLELLYHKGEQPIQRIGQKVLLASSSITYVVDKLEEKKYLARKACPTDRRVTYAVITESGQKLMDEIFPQHAQAISEIMGGLDTEEKKTVIEQIKRLGLYAQEL